MLAQIDRTWYGNRVRRIPDSEDAAGFCGDLSGTSKGGQRMAWLLTGIILVVFLCLVGCLCITAKRADQEIEQFRQKMLQQ